MGCAPSVHIRCGGGGGAKKRRKRRSVIQEVAVFVPALRAPAPADVARPLRGLVSKPVADRLAALRARVVSSADEIHLAGVSAVGDLQRALNDYLPLVLGLARRESLVESAVEFEWSSLVDGDEGCCIASAWYEVLSVVHLMAMLALLEANMRLTARGSGGGDRKVCEDAKKDVIDLLLKASGCLDCCVRHILVQMPPQVRKVLPREFDQGMLKAISIIALAQCVEIQLGLAVECEKATLAVKRRLACEMVSYLAQAQESLSGADTGDSAGKKLSLFLKWKCLEAKAVAYYYHGLLTDKGSEPGCHLAAICCLSAAEELLNEGKKASLSFCLAAPVTRVPPPWGVMTNMHTKIPAAASKRIQMYRDLLEHDDEGVLQSLPDLPEFELALKPEGYELPGVDPSWDDERCLPKAQSLKEHLDDDGGGGGGGGGGEDCGRWSGAEE